MNLVKNKNKIAVIAADLLFFTAGSVLYAVAVDSFTAPNDIVLGGITGLATVLNYLFKIPIGITVFILNIPILFIAYKRFGFGYIKKTAVAVVISSVLIDLLVPILPVFKGDLLLASLYGGIFTGAGIGVIMLRGGSTGGVDIIALMFNKRFPQISVGKIMLYIDLIIVAFAAYAYKSLELALYAVVTIYLTSKVIDSVLYGVEKAKVAMVISSKTAEIYGEVNSVLKRGGTFLQSKGAYSGKNGDILLCAVRQNEIQKLRQLVQSIDEQAFFLIIQADEIIGEGFTFDK